MKHVTNQQKRKSPNREKPFGKDPVDHVLLQGMPLRHYPGRYQTSPRAKDWFASLIWLRIPLLLLGVVGALGLLAQYNPRFADTFRIAGWLDLEVSIGLLSIAALVFLLLLVDWFVEKVHRCIRWVQRLKHPGYREWRCR